jgi:2-polyprenyl-3-methyl-5-hydroxy-6-metoxy-1,4-benzoquinol methylase
MPCEMLGETRRTPVADPAPAPTPPAGSPIWKRGIRAAVRRALDQRRIRALVEADLASRRGRTRNDLPKPVAEGSVDSGVFVDRFGTGHPLDPGLRDRLKPQWRTMFDPVARAQPFSDAVLASRAAKAERTVAEASALVASVAGVPLAGRILEVGCHDGAVAHQLSRRPGTVVVASDMARYYLVPGADASSADELDGQQVKLAELRARARTFAGPDVGPVEFVEDDITATNLAPASFDAIVSFEVLEHVGSPAAAFASMARLLKLGGIAYHDYNPFFSSNGGHSLCTLDFPWGHARLDPLDFERYLREIRPTETDEALRFYLESLNRMTMADLREAVEASGLELLAVIPWTDRKLVPQLGESVLAEVRRTYPTATATDLLATFVSVVARRPVGGGDSPPSSGQP